MIIITIIIIMIIIIIIIIIIVIFIYLHSAISYKIHCPVGLYKTLKSVAITLWWLARD